MRFLLYLLLTLFASQLLRAQSYPTGTRTVTYTDPARSNRSIDVEFHYPATTAGSNTPIANDSFNFIVFGHGFQMTSSAYLPYSDSLATNGYIVAYPATESSLSPSHSSFAQDLIFIYNKLLSENNNAASPFYGKIKMKGAIAGHSMGGGCTVLSAFYSNPATCYFTFAAANTNPSSISAARSMTKPYLDFAGSYDCIAPYAAHQLPMYDSSASPCKVLVEINGASHCQFGAGNFQCNLGEGVSGCASPPTSRTSQINTTLGYLYPFLKYYLREDTTAKTAFDNVYTTDAVNTKKRSCNAVQTDISEHIDKTLSIYPNPVTDQLHIESIDKITSIKIIDLMGRAVVSTTGSEHTIIDISSLAGGIYQVQLSDQEGKTRTKRINKRP